MINLLFIKTHLTSEMLLHNITFSECYITQVTNKVLYYSVIS